MPGPPPKRSAERRRRNSPLAETVHVPGLSVTHPEVDHRLHHLARDWYESLAQSGQAVYFEPSDWQAALVVARSLSKVLSAKKLSAVAFAAVWAAMGDLMTTEAARRRLRVEIERVDAPDDDSGVTKMDDYRDMVGS